MESIAQFLTSIVPAALVLFAMYLAIKSFLDREAKSRMIDKKISAQETLLPIRLQAYERICLFLERVSPNNLVLRLNNGVYSKAEFHSILMHEIREEFGHNYAQQMYLTDNAWDAVKQAVDALHMIINESASVVHEEGTSIDLAKAIFENMATKEVDPIYAALAIVKNEARLLFD